MENIKHLYFLSWEDLSYSRTGVLYHGLTGRNINYQAINFPKKNYQKLLKRFVNLKVNLGNKAL
jgi:hypothetical protein